MDRRNFLKLLAAAGAVATLPAANVVFPETTPALSPRQSGYYRANGLHIQWGTAHAGGRVTLPAQFDIDARILGVFVTGDQAHFGTASGLDRDGFTLHTDGGSRYQWMAVAVDPYATSLGSIATSVNNVEIAAMG